MNTNWSVGDRNTIPGLWEKAVAKTPDKTFLWFLVNDEKYTYKEFDLLTNRLANGLVAAGVKPGDRVGALLDSNSDAVALCFAAAKVNAVYVAINTANKGEFLLNPLSNSGSSIIIAEAHYCERVEALADKLDEVKHVYVRGEYEGALSLPNSSISKLKTDNDQPCGVAVDPSDIAGIIYTGGTTGPSKGCTLSQNYIANMAIRCIDMCGPRPDDVNWTCLPLFHLNALTTTILYAAVTNTTAAITARFSLSNFWKDIKKSGATNAMVLGAMIPLIANQDDTPEMLECKGQLRLARGAPFPSEMQEIWRDRFGAEIIGAHVYGLTEASFLTMLPHEESKEAAPGSSGKVNHHDFDVMIVDDNFNEVPVGQSGEVVCRPKRPNVMFEGYWGRPEETLKIMGGLWMHTGDIGKFDEEGFFYFVDRQKDYLRRRGENISSYEMETTFNQHEAIEEVAVHAVLSEFTEDDVKVTAVLKEGASVTEEELARWAIENVPYYAVPRYIEFREALPKSPVGRILKNQLRDDGCTENTWDIEKSDVKFDKR